MQNNYLSFCHIIFFFLLQSCDSLIPHWLWYDFFFSSSIFALCHFPHLLGCEMVKLEKNIMSEFNSYKEFFFSDSRSTIQTKNGATEVVDMVGNVEIHRNDGRFPFYPHTHTQKLDFQFPPAHELFSRKNWLRKFQANWSLDAVVESWIQMFSVEFRKKHNVLCALKSWLREQCAKNTIERRLTSGSTTNWGASQMRENECEPTENQANIAMK